MKLHSPGLYRSKRGWIAPALIAGAAFALYCIEGAVTNAMQQQHEYEFAPVVNGLRQPPLKRREQVRVLPGVPNNLESDARTRDFPIVPKDGSEVAVRSARNTLMSQGAVRAREHDLEREYSASQPPTARHLSPPGPDFGIMTHTSEKPRGVFTAPLKRPVVHAGRQSSRGVVPAAPQPSSSRRMVSGENPVSPNHASLDSGVGVGMQPTKAVHETKAGWKKTKATFYGTGYLKPRKGQTNYDDGKRRLCADSKTVYTTNGAFCAAWVVPLGTMIEVRHGTRTMTLKVTDRQANRKTKLLDVPTGTWQKLTGQPLSRGLAQVEWRVKK